MPIKKFVYDGGFILGICLGMQLLFDRSQKWVHLMDWVLSGTVKKLKKSDNNNFEYLILDGILLIKKKMTINQIIFL